MKSEFLTNMSHELRTPLNAIIGFSEVLRDGLIGELTDKRRGFISDIFGSGMHLLSLINDILDLSKVEAGKMMVDLETVPMKPTFVNSLSIIREKAASRRIRLHLDLGATEDVGVIEADPRKVKQILYTLLSNAVKFTPEGVRSRYAPPLSGAPTWETATAPGQAGAFHWPTMASRTFSRFVSRTAASAFHRSGLSGSSSRSARSTAARRANSRAPASGWPW